MLYEILRDSARLEEVVERIEKDAPSFAEIAREKSKSSVDWKFVMLTLLTFLLGPAYAQMVLNEPPSREEIERIIREQLRNLSSVNLCTLISVISRPWFAEEESCPRRGPPTVRAPYYQRGLAVVAGNGRDQPT
jgi:hypothetical protein